jgi:hypothetical protein
MSIIDERLPYVEELHLGRGSHDPPTNGLEAACVMEAVAYVAGERFSDHPACASPIITAFLISWNDSMDDEDRQMLKPYIPRLVGTRTTKKDEEVRAWMLTDWLARECAPAWMRLAGLTAQAELLESLAPLKSAASARKAKLALDTARKDSAAAWDAAWAAAWDAARAAARDAAGAAARAAARAAAGAAAWAAARAAAAAALAPTTRELQQSALLLLDRMIAVSARGGDAT